MRETERTQVGIAKNCNPFLLLSGQVTRARARALGHPCACSCDDISSMGASMPITSASIPVQPSGWWW